MPQLGPCEAGKMNDLKLPVVIWMILHLVQGGSTLNNIGSLSSNAVNHVSPTHKNGESELGLLKLTKRDTDNGKHFLLFNNCLKTALVLYIT